VSGAEVRAELEMPALLRGKTKKKWYALTRKETD